MTVMTHEVHLQGVPRRYASDLRRAIRRTLVLENAGPGSLTLRLTDEAEMQRLNAAFAHADYATDVLAFPSGDPDVGGNGTYFGDVIIALPLAISQARTAGHDLRSELLLLAVHGTLHLLGHEHADSQGRGTMWQRQDEILADLNCSILSPQGDR